MVNEYNSKGRRIYEANYQRSAHHEENDNYPMSGFAPLQYIIYTIVTNH